jgi:hypothetical protein
MPDAPEHPDNYLTASAAAVAWPSIVSRSRRSARLRCMIAYDADMIAHDADMIGADGRIIAHYRREKKVLPTRFFGCLGQRSRQETLQAYSGGRS